MVFLACLNYQVFLIELVEEKSGDTANPDIFIRTVKFFRKITFVLMMGKEMLMPVK
jgi:hypothetical protein